METIAHAIPTKCPANKPVRVLLVEDDPDSAAAMARLLQTLDYEVEIARNGTEAIVVAASFKPQAVLIDIGLPGLDGHHVARELQKVSATTLLVAVTGRSEPDDLLRSKEAGFHHHFVKPLDFEKLESVLSRQQPDN